MKQMITLEFEGTTVPVHFTNDQPCWLARDLGLALGYAEDGSRLVKSITQRWADEFEEGVDFARKLPESFQGTGTVPSGGRAPIVLFESGVHRVCMLTRKAAGKRFRDWLAIEVLPSLHRTGRYEMPGAESAQPDTSLAARREARLDAQRRSRALDRAAKLAVNEQVRYQLTVEALEIAAGRPLPELYVAARRPEPRNVTPPPMPRKGESAQLSLVEAEVVDPGNAGDWWSPTGIARLLKSSPQMVGRIIVRLDLKGDDRYSRNAPKMANGQLRDCWEYNAAAMQLISDTLAA